MAEMVIVDVDMQDFLDVLYPFLERHDAVNVEMYWQTKDADEEESENIEIEEMVAFIEDRFQGNEDLEKYGIRASSVLITFDFIGDELRIEYPDGFETDMRVFRDLNEADDYQEELMDELDEE